MSNLTIGDCDTAENLLRLPRPAPAPVSLARGDRQNIEARFGSFALAVELFTGALGEGAFLRCTACKNDDALSVSALGVSAPPFLACPQCAGMGYQWQTRTAHGWQLVDWSDLPGGS